MGNSQKMRSPLTILATVVSLAAGQCDDTFPDGTACGAADYAFQPDPAACWKYYECDAGCVRHLTCEEDYKYDIKYEWCAPPRDVECGDRPCDDPVHCPEDLTTTTEEPDCSPPDQIIDCRADEYGPGYYPDEYNCRKFWHCLKGESHGEHIMCPQESDDPKATMFDTSYMGCNFPEQTQCAGRPVCDECNTHCEDTPTTPADCTPDDEHIKCEDLGPGWFPDEFNCRAFWHCLSDESTPEHRFCPEPNNDPKATMFNPRYDGCDFPENVDCGQRPICDECNDNCTDPPPPIDCDHPIDCKDKGTGWYEDPYSCIKYWNCQGSTATHFICPDGLMAKVDEPYNVACDFPDRVDCGSRPPCNECADDCP